jgi:hypothetical protein
MIYISARARRPADRRTNRAGTAALCYVLHLAALLLLPASRAGS